MTKLSVLLISMLLFFSPLYANNMRGPSDFSRNVSPSNHFAHDRPVSTIKWFFGSAISFFSTVISPVDGSRCPSYPTCAAYGKQVLREEGFLWGILLIADRLFHEVEFSPHTPILIKYDTKRFYDPPDNNRFWRMPFNTTNNER